MRILLAIALIAAAFSLWQNRTKSLNAEQLRIDLVELRSQAVQAEIIAEALRTKKITYGYFHGQLRDLQQKTDDLVSELSNTQAQASVRKEASALRELAHQLRTIEQALRSPMDPANIHTNKTSLHPLVEQLIEIEEILLIDDKA